MLRGVRMIDKNAATVAEVNMTPINDTNQYRLINSDLAQRSAILPPTGVVIAFDADGISEWIPATVYLETISIPGFSHHDHKEEVKSGDAVVKPDVAPLTLGKVFPTGPGSALLTGSEDSEPIYTELRDSEPAPESASEPAREVPSGPSEPSEPSESSEPAPEVPAESSEAAPEVAPVVTLTEADITALMGGTPPEESDSVAEMMPRQSGRKG